MLTVLVELTPGCRNEFFACHKAKDCITVLPIMEVKTYWNSTLQLLEGAYWLWEFTREWLHNPKHSDYQPLLTTQDAWTIPNYVMEVFRPFRYWILWMSKRHTVTLHHVITVYNDIFDHMDGVLRALAKKKTQWKEDLFFALNLARQKLSKHYAEVTPTMSMLPIWAHILDLFRKMQLSRKCDKGMDINLEDETSYTTQYQEAFLKYVVNEYCAKHQHVPVNIPKSILSSNLIPSAMASASGQLSFNPYIVISADEEYLLCNNAAEMTPRWCDHAACVLAAARLYSDSLPEAPKNWGQINLNLNDFHSDPMEMSCTFLILDITDWWRQQEKTHSK